MVLPFLPGDSILFIAGTVVAVAGLNVHLLVRRARRRCGARRLGQLRDRPLPSGRACSTGPTRAGCKQEHLRRTQAFYESYGGVTIIIGRFVPVIRTFAPFLAGVAGMSYRRFLSYNVVGGVAWIALLVYAGYLFGNIPWVRDNLALIVVGVRRGVADSGGADVRAASAARDAADAPPR